MTPWVLFLVCILTYNNILLYVNIQAAFGSIPTCVFWMREQGLCGIRRGLGNRLTLVPEFMLSQSHGFLIFFLAFAHRAFAAFLARSFLSCGLSAAIRALTPFPLAALPPFLPINLSHDFGNKVASHPEVMAQESDQDLNDY